MTEIEKIKPGGREPRKIPYKSKDGFIKLNVLRGFTEIKNLFNVIKKEQAFLCGGYVRYMASPADKPTKAANLDIYSLDEKTYEKLKNEFQFKFKLETRHENEMAITYKKIEDAKHKFFSCPPIQLIKPVLEGRIVAIGNMETILENFDFTVIRCGLLSSKKILADADFEYDEKNKILRFKNIHCPISSTLRAVKYGKKGYWLPPFQATKLFMDWDDRSDKYKNTIVNRLTLMNEGVELTQEEIDELEKLMIID